MNKYRAKKTEYGGQWYDSHGEAEYARHLDLLKEAGQIYAWHRGVTYLLLEPPNRITFTPDFVVWPRPGVFRVVDFKGMVTREFRLKAKLFKARYPDTELWIVFSDGTEKRL